MIPVRYLDRCGEPTHDIVNGQPCIDIGIAWDPEAGEQRRDHPRQYMMAIGLLDTGAQGIMCDSSIISAIAPPWTRKVTNKTSNGSTTVIGYCVQLHLPQQQWTMRAEVFSADLRTHGHPYDLLLGRDFLSNSFFTWSGLSGVTSIGIR